MLLTTFSNKKKDIHFGIFLSYLGLFKNNDQSVALLVPTIFIVFETIFFLNLF